MELSGLILFIVGFILGGGLIWFIRQKDINSIEQKLLIRLHQKLTPYDQNLLAEKLNQLVPA